jgi:hypothetical protein
VLNIDYKIGSRQTDRQQVKLKRSVVKMSLLRPQVANKEQFSPKNVEIFVKASGNSCEKHQNS